MTDVDRRSRLRSLKLQTLVRDHLGHEIDATSGVFPPGAALTTAGGAWVLAEDDPQRSLGPALAWALRNGATSLDLVAEHSTGTLARRAAGLRFPIEVWHIDGRTLLPALSEPLLPPPAAQPEHLALVDTIVAGGAEPVVEHGVVTGEVRGLEVCRVVDDAHTGMVRLEVGVGAHDREAFTIIHGDIPTVDALAGVVRAVEEHRRPGAAPHPLQALVPERLLRHRLEQDPSLLGLVTVRRAEPPVPRLNVKDRMPCVAVGERPDGEPVVLVFSVGVDLDLVPYALDARVATEGPGSSRAQAATPGVERGSASRASPRASERSVAVWLVMPARDRVPVTAEIAALAGQALSLVSFSG